MGFESKKNNSNHVVVWVSPHANEHGVTRNSRIIQINGENTTGMPHGEVKAMLTQGKLPCTLTLAPYSKLKKEFIPMGSLAEYNAVRLRLVWFPQMYRMNQHFIKIHDMDEIRYGKLKMVK